MTDRERMLAVWREPCVLRARERLRADSPSILATQVAVSEIPSPTGQEDQRADWLLDRFREASLTDLRRDGAGNVIGVRPGSDADETPVVLCAHLDTVFPAGVSVSVRRDGRRLVGPGIGDNGRGLAALVALAGVIDGVALRPRVPVVFVGTTGEEGSGDLRGAKHLFANGLGAARAAVILDGAGDDRIVHRALGSRRFRIEFRGPGGHSWSSYGAPNAVHAAARCAATLAAIALPDTPRTTLSVGRMGGGMSVNAIPADAWLEVDVRSLAAHVLPRLEERIRAAVHSAVREENDGRAPGSSPLASRLTIIGDRPAGETPFDHPLVAAAVEATRLIGREPALAAASTDANVPISLGIPAVAIGAGGRGGDAHTADEWFEDADGGRGLERALAITMAAAGLSAPRPAPAEV
jgi:tripeptide aminopeptidase